MSYKELGGFAENKYVLDGTEETYNSFNNCLAELYLDAIWSEDFEAIGDVDKYLIRNVAHWLTYDSKIAKKIKDAGKNILTGEIITCNNRQFIYAIIAKNQVSHAKTWLDLGSKNIDLIIYYILNSEEDYDFINNITTNDSREKVIENLSNIFKKMNEIYCSITDKIKEKEFLEKVKNYLYNIRWDKSIGQISFKEIDQDDFIKEHVLSKEMK